MTVVEPKTKLQEIRDKLCRERDESEMGYINGVLDFYNEVNRGKEKKEEKG